MKKIKWDASMSAEANAKTRLPEMAQGWFKAGTELVTAQPSPATQHRFRLDTKAFRYTLEIFRRCYGPGLELRLASLRKVQDCLGVISDCATTLRLIASRLPVEAPERARMEILLSARSKRKLSEFRRFWRQNLSAPAVERRWSTYLSRPRI
jgi:CHAD domain-containing protein